MVTHHDASLRYPVFSSTVRVEAAEIVEHPSPSLIGC